MQLEAEEALLTISPDGTGICMAYFPGVRVRKWRGAIEQTASLCNRILELYGVLNFARLIIECQGASVVTRIGETSCNIAREAKSRSEYQSGRAVWAARLPLVLQVRREVITGSRLKPLDVTTGIRRASARPRRNSHDASPKSVQTVKERFWGSSQANIRYGDFNPQGRSLLMLEVVL